MRGIRTLIIDNYDSFTFNLCQLIGQVNGEEPVVVRNDEMEWPQIGALAFDNIVISPGPGTPERRRDFGVCREAILRATVPVLGVCLGHQGIGHCYGAQVRRAPEPVHGRASIVRHDGSRLFAGVPRDFEAVRYHSLLLDAALPACLRATAWTPDGVLMALEHRDLPRFGLQFHPESIGSAYGDRILKNFRDLTPARPRSAAVPKPRPAPPAASLPYRVHSRRLPFHPARAAQVFTALYGGEPWAFWLDSSHTANGAARFSFMGAAGGPLSLLATCEQGAGDVTVLSSGRVHKVAGDIYTFLSDELARRRCDTSGLPFDFNAGFVGCFSYHRKPAPAATFLFADRLLAFDHETAELWLVSYGAAAAAHAWMEDVARRLPTLPPLPEPGPSHTGLTFRLDRDRARYLADVRRCRQWIRDGESYEICLTNQIRTGPVPDPLALYRRLRKVNPAPYGAFLRLGDHAILSCSPERFLKIDAGGGVESKPIKGTRPRGRTPAEDEALRHDLATSEKDRSENLMIVDLLRNDLGMVSETGSVKVTKLMDVESYQTVHQLVSTVRGWLRDDVDAPACARAAFPGGSMTGAPKHRAMELIDQLETAPRGVYAGALGYFALSGAADLSIVIRTLVCTPEETTLGMGGAVVALSRPEDEFEETLVKARALLRGLILHARGKADDALTGEVIRELRENGHATLLKSI